MVTPVPSPFPDRPLAVLELAGLLASFARERFTPERVFATLRAARVEPRSLAPYVQFDPRHYTRNLVFKHERFEMLALCWEPGQRSSVHNHDGQQCWMVVPVGRLLNQSYRVLELDEQQRLCRLEPASACEISPERPLQVDSAEPIHRVENRPEFGERAVSLHIYSLPYDRCLAYCLETGRYAEVPLSYTPRPADAGRSSR